MRLPFFYLLWVIPFAFCRADNAGDTPAGHSVHGEAFNEGPRQRAYLMEGMPDIDFPVTTPSSEARKFFTQGVGQLHGFWYFEAERSFRQVAALDTNCAMAFWGMAMANVTNEKRARQFIEKATGITNGIGRREFLYIQSLAKFYSAKSGDSKDDRHRQYVKNLEQIVEEFPGDLEAKAFLVFKIWDNEGRLKISSHIATDALARQVLAEKPLHPAHHALIHLWNNEADRRALDSASKCGQGAPGIAHMWHMPGHTYSAIHRYADAAWQQEASARVDHAYMIRNRVLPDQIENYAHNNDWLIKNLSYLGRVHDGLALAKNLVELPRHPQYNNLSRAAPLDTNLIYSAVSTDSAPGSSRRRQASAAFGRTRLCELMVRWELWDDLIAVGQTEYLEPTDLPEEQARRAKALGLAYFSKKDLANGSSQIQVLEAALKEEKELRHVEMEDAETKARAEKKTDDQVSKAMTEVLDAHASRIKSMLNGLTELRLYEFLAQEKNEEATSQLDQVKDLPKERLARIFLELGDNDHAIKRAREAVDASTNEVQVLANYADVLWRCGKTNDATKQFKRLRKLAGCADLDMPIFQRLHPIAEQLELASDWRIAPKAAKDVGNRPSLDKLGPFRWHPSPAHNWALQTSTGRKVALKDYRHRPLVLIFYLGYGCAHCLQQLNLFAPAASGFEKAGISLLAVSADSIAGLQKTLEKSKDAAGFPFPIASDEKLKAFKAYRAYDDFEKTPLHGTFLIDGEGLVRWQDISYEPFTEPQFLLREAKRLLKLPVETQLTHDSQNPRAPKAPNL